MLTRVLEPEGMDSAEEAADYDAMDHREPNERFCADCLRFASFSNALDVGTGTALIPIELCQNRAPLTVIGVDLAAHMLAVATRNVESAKLGARIRLQRIDAKKLPFADGEIEAVVSNSIVHHIPNPAHALGEMARVAGRVLFVRDLLRPDDDTEVRKLVALYGGSPARDDAESHARHARQVALLEASLRAALTLDEVRAITTQLGIPDSCVTRTSDRHFTIAYEKAR